MAPDAEQLIVLGGYTDGSEGGLGRVTLSDKGFGDAERLDGPEGPSWVAPAEAGGAADLLYAVSEGEGGGVVAVRPGSGVVSEAESGGDGPCHLSLSPDGTWLVASNYIGGSVGLVRAGEQLELVDDLRFEGSGPHERQDAPHAHQSTFVGDRELLVCDLGADRVRQVRIEDGDGSGALRHTGDIELPPGTGPRHLALHPTRDDVLWVVGELDLAVHVLRREGAGWRHVMAQTLVPDGRAPGENTAAGIVVDPRAEHLYVSTRGTDTVSVLAVGEDGALTLRQQVATAEWPRFIGWVPGREGERLLVAAERAGSVDVWAVDEGQLEPTGHSLAWPGITWAG